MADSYSTIRHPELLGPFLGQRVVEITQQDRDEFVAEHQSYVALHFENGATLRFPIGDAGFDIEDVPDGR